MHPFRHWLIRFCMFAIVLLGMLQFATPAYAQSDRAISAEDKAAIGQIVEISKKLQEPGLRGQHPKGHGVVWAEFTVEPNLPEDLRVGVFREPGRTFPAWIRFSNSLSMNDTNGQLHGLAIKLMGVEGEKVLESERTAQTQDFVLGDYPVFFSRNAKDFLGFFEALAQAGGKPSVKAFFPGANPLKWHTRELINILPIGRLKITNPLATSYWSQTPYQFGADASKFLVKPTTSISGSIGDTSDYLRSAMANSLKEQEATFDFLIQRQTDTSKMPVNDPTIEWREQDSPPQKVATIRIPRQDFNTPDQNTFGENLSFTPWHSLPEHQPLGSINLARKAIYQTLSEVRHQQTGTLNQEPTPESFTPHLLNQ